MGQDFYTIMCRSLTYAQRASRQLERSGIFSSITKAPQGVTASGCSYGVKVNERNARNAVSVLRGSGIPVGKIYLQSGSGVKEVNL